MKDALRQWVYGHPLWLPSVEDRKTMRRTVKV